MKLEKFEKVFEEQSGFFTQVINSMLKDDPEFDLDQPLYSLGFQCTDGNVCFAPVDPRHLEAANALSGGRADPVEMIKFIASKTPPPEAIKFEDKATGTISQGEGPAEVVMHWSGGWVKDAKTGERTGEEIFSLYMEDRDGNTGVLAFKKTPNGPTHELVQHHEPCISQLDPECHGRMQNFFDIVVTDELAN